jgi:hypothetical protein
VIPVGETKTVDGYQIKVTQDMADYVMDYCKLVWERSAGEDAARRTVPAHRPPDRRGGRPPAPATRSSLTTIRRPSRSSTWKYGMGVRVMAEDNEQMQMYALGSAARAQPGSRISRTSPW